MKDVIWIFGNSVQDVTVEIDLDALSRRRANLRDRISIGERLRIRKGTWLKTQYGPYRFAVKVDLELAKVDDDVCRGDHFYLQPGDKYNLTGEIAESHDGLPEDALPVRCENVSWGGGGLNCAAFTRALAPDPDIVPIVYTDVAMANALHEVLKDYEDIRRQYMPTEAGGEPKTGQLNPLVLSDPATVEECTAQLAVTSARNAPIRSFEVFLATLPVTCLLHRREKPTFRRNWVINRVRSGSREMENKIICRGKLDPVNNSEQELIGRLLTNYDGRLRDKERRVGAVVLDSLRDEPLFLSALDYYQTLRTRDPDALLVLAMTKPMQVFSEHLFRSGSFSQCTIGNVPSVWVFNEVEFHALAQKFDPRLPPFMEAPEDLPNLRRFVDCVCTIHRQFHGGSLPRMFVTLGVRGSLGVDHDSTVFFVSTYAKQGSAIYDTNACGDAYCAAITLLEWQKRQRFSAACARRATPEMIDFMAFGTAAAYCRATSRSGRVDSNDVRDLMDNLHLAGSEVGNAFDLQQDFKDRKQIQRVDEYERLWPPRTAETREISEVMAKLMGLG